MRFILIVLFAICLASSSVSQELPEKILPLNITWDADGTAVTLDWNAARPLRVGPVDINRRPYGARGGQTWQPLVTDLQQRYFFRDETVEPGRAYEYQVVRKARDIVDVGYALVGRGIPAVDTRGVALLVVDKTVAGPLAARLKRFEEDLIGDGWTVVRRAAPRHISGEDARPDNLAEARLLRRWIASEVAKSPRTRHALILFGRVPVVTSGLVAPDGHRRVPHVTDMFYADLGGIWPDAAPGHLRPNALPDRLIDMHVGRIDFAPSAQDDPGLELRLLARYLDKNHHWRHGRHGDLRNAYWASGHLAVEAAALRNLVGGAGIVAGGHHDAGPRASALWGVDFGKPFGRDYSGAGIKAAFAINFGSHKQKFTNKDNAMTALLAQPWYPVAVGWGGRPAWWLHLMALGDTIGEVHFRTVNNGPLRRFYREELDYYPTGTYLWRAPIWVNLLGDPTLRAFPLAPPQNVRAVRTEGDVVVTWAPAEAADVRGTQVYRAARPEDRFMPISDVVRDGRFIDTDAPENARYMLKSYGVKEVEAGSFHTFSQGVFASPGAEPPQPPRLSMAVTAGKAQRLTGLPDGLWSFVEDPADGTLVQDDTGWLYTAPDGFAGTVTLRTAVSRNGQTALGEITLDVTP